MSAVLGSGRAASEAAASFGVSWWLVQGALDSAAPTLPDVDRLTPRMLGIDEHRYRSVRFFRDHGTISWKRYEPWTTTIVDLDTGQFLGVLDDETANGAASCCSPGRFTGGLEVREVAIDPSAAFRKALQMWLPRMVVRWMRSIWSSSATTCSPRSASV